VQLQFLARVFYNVSYAACVAAVQDRVTLEAAENAKAAKMCAPIQARGHFARLPIDINLWTAALFTAWLV
jgi:hypothetical protein